MNVVVTGASGDIGRAVAEEFALNGFTVHGLDYNEPSLDHPMYNHYMCDCANEVLLPDISEVNIIVNCLGSYSNNDALYSNYRAAVTVIEKYCSKNFTKSILNVCSSCVRSGAGIKEYVASKGALQAYTKWLAQDLGMYGITVNSLSPGGVYSDSAKDVMLNEEKMQTIMSQTLLGKWSWPEEIAQWVYFLTVVNKSMTGEDIFIDNGEFIKFNYVK